MEWFKAIADLISNLAWPIVVVIIACVFRSHLVMTLGSVAQRITHAKVEGAGLSAEIELTAQDALVELEAASPRPDAPDDTSQQNTMTIAATGRPLRVIEEAYDAVQDALYRRADRLQDAGNLPYNLDAYGLASILAHHGAIDQALVDAIGVFEELRVQALNASDVSLAASAATRYLGLARSIISRIA